MVLGFLGGAAYYRYRLWTLRRQAPSATVTTASIALSQQDYDRLAKEGKLGKDIAILHRGVVERPPLGLAERFPERSMAGWLLTIWRMKPQT